MELRYKVGNIVVGKIVVNTLQTAFFSSWPEQNLLKVGLTVTKKEWVGINQLDIVLINS